MEAGDRLLLRVDAGLFPTPEDAHRNIVRIFSTTASLQRYSNVTNGIGDVFFRMGQGPWESVVFSRNNVSVLIDSEMQGTCATNIARQIDAAILRASGVPAE